MVWLLPLRRAPMTARRAHDRAWQFAARIAALLLAAYLRRGLCGAATYVHGSLAASDALFGYSDIDLCVVVPDHPTWPGANRRLVQERWRRLKRRSPVLDRTVDLMTWEETELERAVCSSRLTCRCRRDGRRESDASTKCRAGTSPLLWMRPGLYGPMTRWRLLIGPERRPVSPKQSQPDRWEAAWAELQFWCRHAFRAAADPRAHFVPYLSLKLVIEPVRVWLWVVHGIRAERRGEVLERGIELLPEEAETLRWAATLPRVVSEPAREATLASALRGFFHLSERLAERLALEADGWKTVHLVGAGGAATEHSATASFPRSAAGPERIPLVDWVARAWPVELEELCAPCQSDPANPRALRAAMAASAAALYPLVRTGELLVMPVSDLERATRRAMQCKVTDPVTFALSEASSTARFAEIPGWSVSDCAQRAVDEHAARLGFGEPAESPALKPGPDRYAIGMLITATRAALFLESVQGGAPRLAVTLEAVVAELADRDTIAGELLAEAVAAYRGRSTPSLRHGAELRQIVGSLDCFARA